MSISAYLKTGKPILHARKMKNVKAMVIEHGAPAAPTKADVLIKKIS